MWVNEKVGSGALALALYLGLALGPGLTAKIIEIEEEDESVQAATPTPRPKKAPAATPVTAGSKPQGATPAPTPAGTSPKKAEASKPAKAAEGAPGKRVKMGERVGFHYFVKSGFFVKDPSQASFVGKVRNIQDEITFSTPKRCKLQLTEGVASPGIGERLVVFRVQASVQERNSGYNGFWLKNLAVLKVTEVKEEGLLAETVKTYFPFKEGDLVKPYHEEVDRWNQASEKKSLPQEAIHCHVAGGDPDVKHYVQPEFILLTAGSEEGVVEGMVFQIRESPKSLEASVGSAPVGAARVFFAGEGHSLAQVLHSSATLQKGFEAVYEP
jgi:hypothetical protein